MENDTINVDNDMPMDNFDVDDVAGGQTVLESEDVSMEEEEDEDEDDSINIDYPDEVNPHFCPKSSVLKYLVRCSE